MPGTDRRGLRKPFPASEMAASISFRLAFRASRLRRMLARMNWTDFASLGRMR